MKPYRFKAYFVEIKAVTHVIVGRHGLRVVVDHNGLLAKTTKLSNAANGAPIELD